MREYECCQCWSFSVTTGRLILTKDALNATQEVVIGSAGSRWWGFPGTVPENSPWDSPWTPPENSLWDSPWTRPEISPWDSPGTPTGRLTLCAGGRLKEPLALSGITHPWYLQVHRVAKERDKTKNRDVSSLLELRTWWRKLAIVPAAITTSMSGSSGDWTHGMHPGRSFARSPRLFLSEERGLVMYFILLQMQ